MDWREIKRNGFKLVGGVSYDLRHLQDATYAYSIPGTAKHPQLEFKVLIQFSSHCISWGPKRSESIDFSVRGRDARVIDEKGIARCFCPVRHDLSRTLPEVFATLHRRWCYFTGHENWLTIERVNAMGNTEEYECYFNITRQSSAFLRIYVESAYIRTDSSRERQPYRFKHRDKVRGVLLLSKKLRKEPLRPPPRRR